MPTAVPLTTYRLQLTKDFDFDRAASLVPYLKALGISHLYASPFLKARPGSTHGYDIVDHEQFNPELGGEDGFQRLSETLKQHDIGLILDFVPNHMGVGHADNAWWLDVLEWGPRSPYANSFDIDWDGLPHRRHPGVLLPILGRPYGEALQAGEIVLRYDAGTGSFAAWYFDHKLPINPHRYGEIVRTLVAAADAAAEPAGAALLTLVDEYRGPEAPSYRGAADLKAGLAAIENAAAIFDRGLVAYRADTESGAAALHRLLERQNYRIAYWRVAFSAVNYRRFFDINDLAGIRVEHQRTFRAVHGLVARLIAADRLQGLRLDHIDGLRDPVQYTSRLRQLVRKTRAPSRRRGPFYVLVEKILGEGEVMPHFPGVDGTTGYEWLNAITRILVKDDGLASLERTWRLATGEQATFATILRTAKQHVIEALLASEFNVLCRGLARIAAGHFSTRDYTLDRLRAALLRYVLEFPVYRTYATPAGVTPEDRRTIDEAIGRARQHWRGPDPEIFDFLRDAITLDLAANTGYSAPRVRDFALKLQQFTGPLMAKSLEDTAFYRYHRLLALNEVGNDPAAGGLSIDAFHALQQDRVANWPHGLTTTSTHDTKRGEDARARIAALSELTEDWANAVEDWQRLNAHLISGPPGRRRPSRAHEYMLYQALIGAWPDQADGAFTARMQAFALKAAREGKQDTSWTNPNEAYEAALADFVGKLLDPTVSDAFRASFAAFAHRTALLGALNGLSQLALKCLVPGVPDFYQGTELWNLSLVDPDNRTPVDFAARERLLQDVPSDWAALRMVWPDGRIKLALTRHLLRIRRDHPDVFTQGTYEPVHVEGPDASHVVAFSRRWSQTTIIVAVARHFALKTEGGRRWPNGLDAVLDDEGSTWHDLLAPDVTSPAPSLKLSYLLRDLPVSVLRKA